MENLLSDLKYAFRVFFKRPGLTVLTILALGFSMGMATTVFSILNGMFLKPLPFKDYKELHQIALENRNMDASFMPIPYVKYEELEKLGLFTETAAYLSGTINVSGKGLPERYDGAFITPGLPAITGNAPILGRAFSPESALKDGPREVIISHKLWQERFRGDPEIIGTVISANGVPHTIVGVMEKGYRFPSSEVIWMPLHSDMTQGERKHIGGVLVLARMSKGISEEEMQQRLDAFYNSWEDESVEAKKEFRLLSQRFGAIHLNNPTQAFLTATISAVAFILLVSCANVANLLVGRALTRGREMAIRSAIGASRGRIMRQLLTESLLLSLFGSVGGLLYAAWAIDLTLDSSIFKVPYWMQFDLDWRVFLFATVVMLATALVSGMVPAWQASKVDLNEMLKDTAHTSTSFRLGKITRLLAVVQIAFSCALLFGAGLITRHVFRVANMETGYASQEILTMRMGLFPADYPTEADRDAFYARLLERVRSIPDVEEAAVSSWLGQWGNLREPFLYGGGSVEESDNAVIYAFTEAVSTNYFQAFDLQPLQGRLLSEADIAESPPVAVVNQAFALTIFGTENVVGRRINAIGAKARGDDYSSEMEIVGVVRDIRVSDFFQAVNPEPILYVPMSQRDSNFMSLMVRSPRAGDEALLTEIKEAIAGLDPNLPVYFTKTLEEYVNGQIAPFRSLANSFLAIGLIALFLAAIGVYGMLAFNVNRRSREIGIRMALGATTVRIVTQILRQGMLQVVAGLAIGCLLAYLVGLVTRGFIFGVNPGDPSVYAGVLLTLLGVATIAFFVPARKAAQLSPMEALRYE